MKLIIKTKNISLDDPLRVFVEDKIGGLEKFISDRTKTRLRTGPSSRNDLVEISVEIGKPSLHHRSGKIYYAEANMKIGGKLLRADAKDYDLRTAIVEIKNELKKQIEKFKEKKE